LRQSAYIPGAGKPENITLPLICAEWRKLMQNPLKISPYIGRHVDIDTRQPDINRPMYYFIETDYRGTIMRFHLPLVLLLLTALAGPSHAAGRPEEGRAIAERWCVTCHQVGDEQTTVSTEAPPFASIAMKYPDEEGLLALQAFLADPHPVMPDMSLTRQEIRDLVAYIDSL
jgi:cytochrome c551/c552